MDRRYFNRYIILVYVKYFVYINLMSIYLYLNINIR